MSKKILAALAACLMVLFLPTAAGASETEIIYEKSGAEKIYESLDGETRGLLDETGAESIIESGIDAESIFSIIAKAFREKLTEPLKATAAVMAVIIICRLAACFESTSLKSALKFVSAAVCALTVATPVAGLISSAKLITETAGVFLGAAIPVYSVLMISSGDVATASSYSTLTLFASEAVPIISSAVVFPLLYMFIALSVTSAVSSVKLEAFASSVYKFVKWLLILVVTVFSGVLTLQMAINMNADAVTKRTAKLLVSTAVPIVGGAVSDAVGAIQYSLNIVKSGVGAFGVLASVCIFLPIIAEALAWVAVCALSEIAAKLFDMSGIGKFMSVCAGAVKMVLAVMISIAAVSIAAASVVIFASGRV